MYLDRIVGTATKIRVISLFVDDPRLELIEKEVAKAAGCSVSEVNRQIKDLVEAGLLVMTRRGRSKVYSINTHHFLFKPLSRLFRDLNETYLESAKKIARFIAKKFEFETIILIGSAAKKIVKQDLVVSPSDIDILFVCKNKGEANKIKKELVRYVGASTFEEYGINCYPIVISIMEYKERLKKRDPFILEAQTSGVELYGKKPKRTG